MTMSAAEQNAINQAMQTAGLKQVITVQTQGGVNVYKINKIEPIKQLSTTEAQAWAVIYGETIASP